MAAKTSSLSARPGRIIGAGALALLLLAGGCKSKGDLATGFKVVRSLCPAVAIPAYMGDVTLFNPASSRDASAIDVVATVTNLRSTCNEAEQAATITSTASFDVLARRNSGAGARDVTLPYYVAVTRAGNNVVSKHVGQLVVHFADGQLRAQAHGTARGDIQRSAASLPAAVNTKLTRTRKAGDEDAAIDPMSDPVVRNAVRAASFELLVGFNLSDAQLAYNATK